MPETRIDFIFKEAYGYEIKTTVVEWDEATSTWVASDISSFTTRNFEIKKPDGTPVTVAADFETDGTDGVLVKTITEAMGILNQVGFYNLQAVLSNASQYFPTQIVGFDVDDPL